MQSQHFQNVFDNVKSQMTIIVNTKAAIMSFPCLTTSVQLSMFGSSVLCNAFRIVFAVQTRISFWVETPPQSSLCHFFAALSRKKQIDSLTASIFSQNEVVQVMIFFQIVVMKTFTAVFSIVHWVIVVH